MAVAGAAIMFPIPVGVVLHAPAVAVPVSDEIASSLPAGSNPSRRRIRDTRPIAFVPLIMMPDRVPIAFDPYEVRPRSDRTDPQHSGSRRRSYSDTDGYLSGAGGYRQEHESRQFCHHSYPPHQPNSRDVPKPLSFATLMDGLAYNFRSQAPNRTLAICHYGYDPGFPPKPACQSRSN